MKRGIHHGKKRAGGILIAIGAGMIIALMLPFWFWWLIIGIGLLYSGIRLLKR